MESTDRQVKDMKKMKKYTMEEYNLLIEISKEQESNKDNIVFLGLGIILDIILDGCSDVNIIPKKIKEYCNLSNKPIYNVMYRYPRKKLPLLLFNEDMDLRSIALWRIKIGK